MADKIKIFIAILVVFGGVSLFYYFGDQSLLLRVVGLIVMIGVAFSVFFQTNLGRMAWGFIGDAKMEAAKVVWPSMKETRQTTLIVMIMVILVGLMLWAFDSFLLWAVKQLTGQGS